MWAFKKEFSGKLGEMAIRGLSAKDNCLTAIYLISKLIFYECKMCVWGGGKGVSVIPRV